MTLHPALSAAKRALRRTAPKRRSSRVLLGAAALGVALTLGSVVIAPSAAASPFGWCDPDTTFPVPAASDASPVGLGAGTTKQVSITDPGNGATQTFNYVVIPDNERAPLAQYNGAGLSWQQFGQSCMSMEVKATTMIANMMFAIFVTFPLWILGMILNLALSTYLVDALLNLIQPVVQAMQGNLFLQWAPVIIMLTLAGVIIKVARGAVKQGWSTIAWMAIVTAGTSLLFTGPGLTWAKTLNDYTAEITRCAMFSASGAGCTTTDGHVTQSAAGAVTESLASSTWATGIAGDSWNLPAPTSVTLQHRETMPPISDPVTVPIPFDSIPAQSPGHPTYAEVLRWTQTYTAAEMNAKRLTPALTCTSSVDKSPRIEEITDMASDRYKNSEAQSLCSYKFLVRSAIVYDLATTHPDSYTTFAGGGSARFLAALSGLGLTPLAIGFAVMGFMVLLYAVELLGLFVLGPLNALVALREPQVARVWGGAITSTFVKRIGAGFALGFMIWLAGAIQAQVISMLSATGPLGMSPDLARLAPLFTSVGTLVALVAGFMLLRKLNPMLAKAAHTEPDNGRNNTGRRVAGIAAAGLGALVAGGPGGVGAGLLRGLTTRSPVTGAVTGARAGASHKRRADAATARAEKAKVEEPILTEDMSADEIEELHDGAWRTFVGTVRDSDPQVAETLANLDESIAQLAHEAERLSRPVEPAAQQVYERTVRSSWRRQGVSEAEIEERIRQDRERTEVDRTQELAQVLARRDEAIAERGRIDEEATNQKLLAQVTEMLGQHRSAQEIQQRLHLTEEQTSALATFRQVHREADALTYRRDN